MKLLKIVAVLAAVATLQSATFGAIPLVYEEGPNVGQAFTTGRLIWDIFNWDTGTVYQPTIPSPPGVGNAGAGYQGLPELVPNPVGPIAAAVTALDGIQVAPAANAGDYGRYASGGGFKDDTWGIARVNYITDANGFKVWSETGKNQSLYIMFYGMQDIHIEPIFDQFGAYTGEDRIDGVGLKVEIWSQNPIGAINPALGTAAKVNAVGSPLFPTVTMGTLELLMESLPGFINPSNVGAGLASEFESRFDFTQLRGDGEAWMEIIGGASMAYFDQDPFPMNAANAAILGPLGFDTTADFSVRFDTSPNVGGGNWLVTSHDPLECDFVVPEPVTMLGLVLGLSGVGAYVRRRRLV